MENTELKPGDPHGHIGCPSNCTQSSVTVA